MIKIIKTIDVDVSKENTYVYILAKQNDAVSRYLQINMLNEGEPVDISSATSAVLTAVKSDKTVTLTNGVISEGVVTVELTKQTLAADGPVTCFLSVHSNGSILSTMDFTIDVQGTNVDDDSIISSDEYTAFQDALKTIGNLNELKTEVEQAKTEALQAKNDIEAQFPVTPEKTNFAEQTSATEIEQVSMPMDKHENHLIYTLTVIPGIVYKAPDIAGVSIEGAVLHTDQPADEYGRYVLETVQSTVTFTVDSTVSGWGVYAYTTKTSLAIPNLVVDGNQLGAGTVAEDKLSIEVQTKLNIPGGLTEVNTGDIVDAAVTMPKLGEDVKAEINSRYTKQETDAAIHMSGKIIADAVSTSVPSRPYQVGGVSYTIVDGEAVIGEINGGTNNAGWYAGSGDWIIPDYIRTPDGALYPVTTIADDACAYSTSQSGSDGTYPSARVCIPSTMTTIMSRAFNQGSEHGSLTFIINKEPGAFGDPAGWDNAGSQIIYSGDPFVWDTYYTKSEIDPRIEGNWRKITEMTLAEAAVVSVTADAENQPFSLKRFTITVTKPGVAGDTASGYLWLKSTFNNLPKPVVQSNTHSGTLGVKYRICGEMAAHWETDISSSGAQEPSDNTTAAVYRYPLGTRPEVYALGREPITNFILTWGYSDALPAGTSIEIWGMDA